MAFTNGIVALVAIFLFTSNIKLAQSLDMAYCANINTASTNGSKYLDSQILMLHANFCQDSSIYQSDGLCHDFCLSDYAFSILQDDSCWCSNYVPDKTTQVDTDECDISCHGFPSDTCGGDGLWGYIALDKEPVGTSGASTSTKISSPVSVPVFVLFKESVPLRIMSSGFSFFAACLHSITTTGGLLV